MFYFVLINLQLVLKSTYVIESIFSFFPESILFIKFFNILILFIVTSSFLLSFLGICLDKSPLTVYNCTILSFKSSIIFSNDILKSFLANLTVVNAGDLKTIKSFPPNQH